MSNSHGNKIPILSFFSGGGFLDMGFEDAGFSIVWTNENDELFAKMHAAGITSWRKARGNGVKAEIFNTQSIEDITPGQIIKEAFPKGRPAKFGIIGGPPCQDFSTSGNGKGFEGDKGRLTKIFFDYILEIEPLFFVFENVKNLWNNNDHKEKFRRLLKKVEAKYLIDQKILNAIEFGVPQDRNRLFVVGIKKPDRSDIVEPKFNFPWPSNKQFSEALTKYKWPTTHKFQNGVRAPKGIPSELYINDLMLREREEASIPNGTEYFLPHCSKFWEIEEGNTLNRSFKRLHRYRYSPTACYGNNEVHLHPFLPRRISVREALRIQSVDDTYVLPDDVGMTQKFKMIGNGVPVKLSKAVAKALMAFLDSYCK